jgi:hypothetical protein
MTDNTFESLWVLGTMAHSPGNRQLGCTPQFVAKAKALAGWLMPNDAVFTMNRLGMREYGIPADDFIQFDVVGTEFRATRARVGGQVYQIENSVPIAFVVVTGS